jgi:hypothetical protein
LEICSRWSSIDIYLLKASAIASARDWRGNVGRNSSFSSLVHISFAGANEELVGERNFPIKHLFPEKLVICAIVKV